MKLAVSNIAWSPPDRMDAYNILKNHGVTGLEIAPGLLFHAAEDAFNPSAEVAKAAISEISEAGIRLGSMQSLLYGTKGAAIFEGEESLAKFQDGMHRAIHLAGRFSIPNLVFGSPQQRLVPEQMKHTQAEGLAVDIFRDLGKHAAKANTAIAIEFNPPAYGTNFLNDIEQTIRFVEKVNHSSVTLNLDIGAMHMNNQFNNIESYIKQANRLISHVHISEPNLVPAPANVENAARVLKALNGIGYDRYVSIEMKPDSDKGLTTLDKCITRLVEAVAISSATNK